MYSDICELLSFSSTSLVLITVVSLATLHKPPEALARYYVMSYWQAEWIKKLRWKTIELPSPPRLVHTIQSLRSNDRYLPIKSPTFVVSDNVFDVTKRKSKDYYTLLVREKAKLPNIIQKLQGNFNFNSDHLKQMFKVFPIRYSFSETIPMSFNLLESDFNLSLSHRYKIFISDWL